MPVKKLKDFLDKENIKYVSINHSLAYTAQEIAESAHVSAKKLAKTVIVKLDGKQTMVVVPANVRVDLDALKRITGAKEAELASEFEFKDRFPGCELGAMPPFGHLYDMDLYVSDELKDSHIAFNAGNHSELIQLSYGDFERLAQPRIISLPHS